MDKILVKVDNTNFIKPLSDSHIIITSPSGNSIRIRRTSMSRFTQQQLKLFWKFCGDPKDKREGFEVSTDKSEMSDLLIMSKM